MEQFGYDERLTMRRCVANVNALCVFCLPMLQLVSILSAISADPLESVFLSLGAA
jgi:hypothetical protein